jgi:3-methyladenine DNA glycosylase/8-oxoguanine DNA glycosylase
MISKTLEIDAPSGFALKPTVLSHGWHECSPMNWSDGGRCFQILERIGDQPFRVSVTESTAQRNGEPQLAVTIDTDRRFGTKIANDAVETICERLRITLGLKRDLAPFYSLCRKHPALKVVPRIGAGRLIRSASITENVVKFLCATNVNWTQAVKMINRIGQLGPNLRDFRGFNAWPTPREILRAGEKYLLEVCRVGYRSRSILEVCDRVVSGELDTEEFDRMAADPKVSSDEIVKDLREIHGIGLASANGLLGFLGRNDRLSVDSATFANVAKLHTNGRKPTLKKIERIYEPYGDWKHLVCWLENWITWDSAQGIIAESAKSRRRTRITEPV